MTAAARPRCNLPWVRSATDGFSRVAIAPRLSPAACAHLGAVAKANRLDTWGDAALLLLAAVAADDAAEGRVSPLDPARLPRPVPKALRTRRAPDLKAQGVFIDLAPSLAAHLARIAARARVSIPHAAAALLESIAAEDLAADAAPIPEARP